GGVRGGNPAQGHGHLQDLATGGFRDVERGHRDVTGAEVDGVGLELLNAASAADRGVVDGHTRVLLVVDVERLREQWLVKGGACSGESACGGMEVGLRVRIFGGRCAC